MTKWKTQYDPHQSLPSEPGDPIVYEYVGHYDQDGQLVLVESGKKNLYDEIQSHEPYCNINSILARYKAGDDSVLNQSGFRFGDFTLVPNNMIDAINQLEDAKAVFKKLPLEERQKYGQSFEKWVACFGEFGAVSVPPEVVQKELVNDVGSVSQNVEGVSSNES